MANPGDRPSGQYVVHNGQRVQLQQGYGLSTTPRQGYVPVRFRGQAMYATPRDFVAAAKPPVSMIGVALSKGRAGRM